MLTLTDTQKVYLTRFQSHFFLIQTFNFLKTKNRDSNFLDRMSNLKPPTWSGPPLKPETDYLPSAFNNVLNILANKTCNKNFIKLLK